MRPPTEDQRRQNPVAMEVIRVLPTLSDPTDHNPVRGCASARVNALAHPLGATADELRKSLGRGFENWFAGVTVIGLEGGTLKLGAPTPFVRDYLQRKYEFETLQAWNSTHDRTQLAQRVDFIAIGGRLK